MAAAEAGAEALAASVRDFVSGQQDGRATEVAAGVKDGRWTVLQLVEALGFCLENTDPRTRGRGIQLLSQVLLQCYSLLQEKEVLHLVLFYESRLQDHHLVIPSVLQGLRALSMCEVLSPGLAVSVLKAIFQEVHVQSLLQLDRYTVYSIITNFMSTREEELKGLGANFTFGFIQVMDGEKDPRNLLVAFQIVRDLIAKDYALGPFVEELFEVTSCYFPVDFTPPPNDPHGIQREDLILSLRAVLASTPQFAEFLLPLLIEKLDSELQSAKLDSLQTLTACCAIYGQKELQEFLPSLWSSLRREVFQTASEKIETECLAALHALSACLSRSVLSSDSEDLLDSFLSSILQDCRHHLCEPDMKLVWPSAKLLQAAAGASLRTFHRITRSVLPLLLEQYTKHTQSSQRRTILEMLLGFLELQQKWGHVEEDENTLLSLQALVCSVVFSALMDPSVQLQLVGIKALTVLGSLQGFLSSSDLELVVDHLIRLALHEEDSQSSEAAMEAAGSMAPTYPKVFSGRMVPRLEEELQSEREESSHNHHSLQQRCLQALAAVSTHTSIVRETVPVLLQHLQKVQKGTEARNTQEMVSVCQSLHHVALQCQQDAESCWYFHQTVVPCLLAMAVQAAMQESTHTLPGKALLEEEVLAAMIPVISAATTHLSPELAAQSVSHIVPLFLDGEVSFLPQNSFPSSFQPFGDGECLEAQRRLVALLMAFVCSLPRDVGIPQQEWLLRELLALSCSCNCPFTATTAAKCFAGLVNKHPAGQQLDEILQLAVNRMEPILAEGPCRTQALTLLLWVTKALVLRYHPLSSCLTDKLLGLLGDTELGPAAADGFSLLMAESPDVLHKSCHADVRIMFRQRFFTDNVPKLVQGFHGAGPDVKANYLKGLSHVLNHLPKPVLVTELPTLLSLLLEALSCSDCVVQLSTLSCLHPLLLEAPQVMSLHVDTLVTKFLNLTSSPTMAVRIAALRCAHALTSLPTTVLLPYKGRVIRALAKPLDDKKRLVRKEAVAARGEWFLVGSPGR
ncbi:PREDICTED: MMS19 nucleotide excision repair protein homolog isoform X1 [Pseudopodoces humilis]|uniref:MMS19 nucleotide excision repair protein homolog isoform X1 n=1 Tax=Pseudopodoces humilis TaxID=181119 RepID=UPI0006B777D3|nr:PREDICTED: MMS19 nucleotide excision repair protein homolog isoform X1 [Pseudopodoces humilis]